MGNGNIIFKKQENKFYPKKEQNQVIQTTEVIQTRSESYAKLKKTVSNELKEYEVFSSSLDGVNCEEYYSKVWKKKNDYIINSNFRYYENDSFSGERIILGTGSNGVVFLTKNKESCQECALKCIPLRITFEGENCEKKDKNPQECDLMDQVLFNLGAKRKQVK